ncbi:MAG: ABC transporter substrate-binding protein, partial [Candidatus Nanohaloarchaea archaeon]|nr:ABC transporter substrate-binding protein [Candidatus Nanohaloarchaea archaeon]
MSALAGCSGGGDGGDGEATEAETETETEMDSGGGDTETPTEAGAEMGDPLPEYRYFNNPPNYNPARNDAINLMGEQLNKVGFNMNVKVFEWGTLYNKVTSEQDFEFTTWHRGLGIDPGRRMPEMFHSSNTQSGGGNFVGYVNKDLDPKLMKQMQTTDRQERINLLHDIQEVITRDAPINPITQMPILVAYNNDQVSGWEDHLGGYNYYYNMTTIEVDNSKNQLRGSWSETLGTLNVLGFNNESKLLYQFNMIYDNLISFNPSLQPEPEISLAESWERPEKTTMRYTLKDHQWHDGEDLTAEDVAFTLNYIKENEIPLYSTQWEMYSDAEAVDSQTVQVNFTEDGAPGPVHTLFSSQIPILPQHIWSKRDQPNKMQVKEPVGSGPMKFDYWDTGSELGLVRNGDHFNPVNFD